jgi:hypothetical protein
MATSSPPALNLKYVCVTSKDNSVVGALVSSYFNDAGTYFIVLTLPSLTIPYTKTIDFQKDDYFPQLMGTQAAARINNVIARLRPVGVFLAGLNEAQKSYIRAYLPDRILIEVDNSADVEQALRPVANKTFNGTMACRSSEVVQGLLLAKYTNQRLSIDETAASLPDKHLAQGAGLVVIETTGLPMKLWQ